MSNSYIIHDIVSNRNPPITYKIRTSPKTINKPITNPIQYIEKKNSLLTKCLFHSNNDCKLIINFLDGTATHISTYTDKPNQRLTAEVNVITRKIEDICPETPVSTFYSCNWEDNAVLFDQFYKLMPDELTSKHDVVLFAKENVLVGARGKVFIVNNFSIPIKRNKKAFKEKYNEIKTINALLPQSKTALKCEKTNCQFKNRHVALWAHSRYCQDNINKRIAKNTKIIS